MPVPKFDNFLYPFMLHLLEKDSNKQDMISAMIDYFGLSEDDCKIMTKSGNHPQINDRVGWSLQWLRRAKFVEIPKRGVWRITPRGREYMANHEDLREADLLQFPEFAEYSGRNKKRKNKSKTKNGSINQTVINDDWLEIVETIKPHVESKVSYTLYFNSVVNALRLLGWKKTKGTIKLSPNNDIQNKSVILINLINKSKQIPVLPVDLNKKVEERKQDLNLLFKVMREKKSNIGILFSETINIYYMRGKTNSDAPDCIMVIRYDNNDINGAVLCDLLSYDTFKYEKIDSYCKKLLDNNSIVFKIRQEIDSILRDSRLLKRILADHLVKEGHNENDVLQVLQDYEFNPEVNSNFSDEKVPDIEVPHRNSRDTTQFSFDGGKTYYNKRQFVLNIIKDYVKKHPSVSFEKLETIFPPELSTTKVRGVIKPLKIIEKWIKENPDIRKRYFLSPSDIITLGDGTQVVVHNQWGNHFPFFLNAAKKIYDIKSNQPYQDIVSEDMVESEQTEQTGIVITLDSINKFKNQK